MTAPCRLGPRHPTRSRAKRARLARTRPRDVRVAACDCGGYHLEPAHLTNREQES